MYSLAVAHINDYLRSDEIIAATSTFSILVGVGAIIGPIIVSSIMTVIGSNGFFIYLFVVHILLGLFGLYRMSKRTKSLILIIFSLTAFFVYQYVIGILILLLAIHTLMNDWSSSIIWC